MDRHGRAEEEVFLNNQPAAKTDSEVPAVGPLRINKAYPSSNSSTPSRNTPSPSDSARGAPPSASLYKPPNAPLPYPDDRPRPSQQQQQQQQQQVASVSSKSSTPEGRGRGSSIASGSPRARFDANDPNRPTVSGYAHAPAKDLGTGSLTAAQSSRPNGTTASSDSGRKPSGGTSNPFPDYHQQYWPIPGSASNSKPPQQQQQQNSGGGLKIPTAAGGSGITRLDSTASVSTTRATRGSPPPPETPIADLPAGGIEARYAAAGIGALSAAAGVGSAVAQRQAQYVNSQQQRPSATPPMPQQQQQQQPLTQTPPRRPWTPTEAPGSQPHGPPTVYQGDSVVEYPAAPNSSGAQAKPQPAEQHSASTGSPTASRVGTQALDQDFNRMNLNEEPPPAYSSVQPLTGGQPNEKSRPADIVSPLPAAGAAQLPHNQGHPAFDPRVQGATSSPSQAGSASSVYNMNVSPASVAMAVASSTATAAGPSSPPPLPEGWIAHLDPKSGQYYYIHLATQSTQWEFPKGPTPLNLNEPLSPTGTFVNPLASPVSTTFGKPLASPGFPVPQSATYKHDAYMSMSGMASPTAAGFTGPPPTAGVDVYKVAPTNSVYFGPYLRYTNMDVERGLWLGSVLLVTDAAQPPTIHIHQSVDLSPNPAQLKPNPIYSHQRWIFYRYDIEITMEEQGSKWTYAITSHLGCTRYEFLVAGRYETSWRFIAHSGNDFALNVNANERAKLGGVGFMWKDILQKHIECNGFHAQLGLGDQIFADRMWKELALLKQWTATSGKDIRKNAQWTPTHEEEVTHAYFHYYTSHFDQPHLREAFAQIPHILSLDDREIFDGYGSYPEYMQYSNMFKNIGRIGIEMFLLFQHHTTMDILRNVNDDSDLFTITGTGWHFIKYLGPAVVVVGPDCRSERNPSQVMAGPTYQGLFPKVAVLPPSVQHCIWMIPVPIVYPRLESMEHLASTVATGKKAVTGTFNMLGKVTSSVAGVVGAKGVVGDGFNTVKKAVGKSGLMSGILSPFGEIDLLDELRDLWTHESKDLERTYLIRTLQGIAHNKSLRMTFFSGDVSACGAGLLHDPGHPQDHKTMYQIITSPVVNAPPSGYLLRLLHNSKPLYVPANGHRSQHSPSDTKEDMMEIFSQDVNGQPRELKRLMGRRNYVACVAFDPEVVQGAFGQTTPGQGGGRLSLAVDFMVQGDGIYAGAVKYGPVIVPSLEYGR